MEKDKEETNNNLLDKKRKIDPTRPVWEPHIDGVSNARGASAGIMLTNPMGKS